ncbi:hypothetical protein BDZ97DRAFT_1735864, partial [Flammula alnicola]
MLSNLSNAVITGGTYSQHSVTTILNANAEFKRLQDSVASSAFHNSEQHVDPPKCHPNTRLAVLQKIMEWIQHSEDRDTWIMWLNGAAGAGKSAIARSIAEMCERAKLALVTFFFFRADPTRNTAKPLAATLAYQLAISFPLTRKIIVEVLDRDPLLFRRSFQSQLKALIIEPLVQIRQQSDSSANLTSPFLIILDGLDECDGRDVQTNIIHAISDALRDTNLPIVCLIASRSEQQITMAFNSRKVTDIVTRLPLDDTYLPDEDIRLFLNDKFAEIKDSHPFNHLIDPSWPPETIVETIIEKSSGQFIYASVVINF